MQLRHTIVTALLLIWIAGCDFQAAEDAFTSFDVVIELEPINTVVNGIVVDNDGDLVTARLTFEGPDAGSLIDAYSDPISTLDANGGLVTFGINNAVVPSSASPVEFRVRATADGYFTSDEMVSISTTGDASFTITMIPTDIMNDRAAGTESVQNAGLTAAAGGAIEQSLIVQTPRTAATTASAALSVPQGVRLVTASGEALSGPLTTQLRSYDSGNGLNALPAAALLSGNGTNQAVGGAVFFLMSDAAGRIALSALPPQGVSAAKSAATCSGLLFTLESTDPALVDLYNTLGPVAVEVYAYTPADGANVQVAASTLQAGGSGVTVDICIGGAAGDTGLVDTAAIGNADDGIIYTYAVPSSLAATGALGTAVSLTGFSGTKAISFTLAGPGINESASVSVAGGSTHPLSDLVQTAGSEFTIVNSASYVLSASYAGSDVVVSEAVPDPLGGSVSISLPATTDLQTFALTASLQCDDPSTQQFEVQVTEQSLDAVSVFYRIDGSGNSWTTLARNGLSKTVTDASIVITGSLDLRPSTTYRFRGVLGTDSSESVETTPASGVDWNIELSTSDIGIGCKSR